MCEGATAKQTGFHEKYVSKVDMRAGYAVVLSENEEIRCEYILKKDKSARDD